MKKKSTLSWEEMYAYAKAYYEKNGNLEILGKFKTNNGYEYDENGKINLGIWIQNQRQNTLPESERGQLLSQIGMRFENKKSTLSWEEMYEYAKAYYKEHDNLEIPQRFKTNNGYEYEENGKINLGPWIGTQRRKTLLESERGQLLSQIGMRFENIRSTLSWEEMYEYAKTYYEKNGNLEIPGKFKTNNGYEYEENGKINLGPWIRTQRQFTSRESERGRLLSQIGMRFEKIIGTLSWEDIYKYAKTYYEKNGNLEIPGKFKTNNGYEYEENGKINLGIWIQNQRQFTSIGSERGQLLSQIGMRFENKISTLSWEEMYAYAKTYYEKNGNLAIPRSFKTNNGYEYDENGKINLGVWIGTQRRTTLPESERGQLLSMIGMIWNIKQNKEKISSICIQNNIDYNINKNVLSHITIQEFQSKISYLEENNISLVDANGNLHEIFSMSSLNMKVNYGITLEELINKYYINNVAKKKIKRNY